MASSSSGTNPTSPVPQNNSANSSTAWSEPPWCGWIETTGDALLILEAARRGLIPRVTRRLVDAERKMITSGSVFVFDEDESGIKRWTDGFFWSPSRILGNFLIYRETDKRGGNGQRSAAGALKSDPNSPTTDQPMLVSESGQDGQALSRPKSETLTSLDKHRERTLLGSLTNSYKFKNDGLMKKTFSLTIGGVSQHLISYYKVEDVEKGRLRTPSSLPEIASLDISPEYLDKTHFRNPPKVELGVDGVLRYRGEADEPDHHISGSSHQQHHGNHSTSSNANHSENSLGRPALPPMLTEGKDDGSESPVTPTTKRGKRFDPYGAAMGSETQTKRSRKSRTSNTNTQNGNGVDYSGQPTSPTSYATSPQTPYPMSATSTSGSTDPNSMNSSQHAAMYPAYSIPPPPPAAYYSGQMPVQMPGYPMYGVPPPSQTPSNATVSSATEGGPGSANPSPSPPHQPPSTSPPPPGYGTPYGHDPNSIAAGSTYSYYPPPAHYTHAYGAMPPWPPYPPPGYPIHPAHPHSHVPPPMMGMQAQQTRDVEVADIENSSPEGDRDEDT